MDPSGRTAEYVNEECANYISLTLVLPDSPHGNQGRWGRLCQMIQPPPTTSSPE